MGVEWQLDWPEEYALPFSKVYTDSRIQTEYHEKTDGNLKKETPFLLAWI
jgi:hypothetical protein